MSIIKKLALPLLFVFSLLVSLPFQSCTPDDDDDKKECDTCMVVYKPNIYIYPNKQIKLLVKLDFPLGGKIITSIPEYGTGWNISVDTNGLIDNKYSYLFYESTQPDIWQRNEGWIVAKNDLETFFRNNMTEYGFNGQETEDFIEYWIPRLNNYPFYSILPQITDLIENVIQLNFSKQPDNKLRLFYVIIGNNSLPNKLVEPIINDFQREGYFAVEWGVVIE